MHAHRPLIMLAGVSLLGMSVSAVHADAPQGGKVASGQAIISQTTRTTTIRQSSQRAVIDWRSFDIGKKHGVVFDQPGRSAATLNRVNSARSSVIEGSIKAPGTVVIQNTAGVIFTGDARVDVGSLIATSQLIDSDYFQKTGNYQIGGGELSGARIRNEGELTIGEAGLAALVGTSVENAGVIVANRGTIALASGERTTIDLTGEGIYQIAVEGASPGGGVRHSGTIDAEGGQVLLTAGGAASALDGVINTSGLIRASSSTTNGGKVQLLGRGSGRVQVSGRVEAAGATRGGEIEVTGERVRLTDTANLNASGLDDGGRVLIGGDYQGQGDLRRAGDTVLDDGSTVRADGGEGKGGTVIVWSDESTWVNGIISATGAAAGGLIETSSKGQLGVGGQAEVTAGMGGEWLLDPRDILIVDRGNNPPPIGFPPPEPNGDPYLVSVSALESALGTGSNVTLATDPNDTVSPGNGDITTERSTIIQWRTAANLTFDAAGDVILNGTIRSQGGGNFIALADGDINVNPRSTNPNSVAILTDNAPANVTLEAGGNVSITDRIAITEGGLFTARAGGNISVTDSIAVAGAALAPTNTGVVLETLGTAPGTSNIALSASVGTADGGDITITSAGSLDLSGAGGVDAFNLNLGVRPPGDVSITAADTIELQTGTFVRNENGGDLTMVAPSQIWDGQVSVGSGNDDGGNVTLAGNIMASVQPVFGLGTDKDFILGNVPGITSNSYVSATEPLFVSTQGPQGTISLNGDVTAPKVDLIAVDADPATPDGSVLIGPATTITGTGPGDAVVIATDNRFVNLNPDPQDAIKVTDPTARWLVYINRFADLTGTAPGPRDYDLYGREYNQNPPASLSGIPGNRILYREQPILVLTADDRTKIYGDDVTGTLTYSVSHIDSSTGPDGAPGFRPGDSEQTALTGPPTVDSPGAPATATVGFYPIDVAATASDQGYLLQLVPGDTTPGTGGGTLTIDPAPLTITALDQNEVYGDPFSFAGTEFTATGLKNQDTVATVTLTSAGQPQTANVGSYAIDASAAVGTGLGNYTITYTPGDTTAGSGGGTFVRTAAPLTITADDQTKSYGQTFTFNGSEFTATGLL
ncbi:MAG: MBG domain-containing protein, partial [Gammaproteobacteria bacterium]